MPGKDRDGRGDRADVEPDVERTSQSVPLKSLDGTPAKSPRPAGTQKSGKDGKAAGPAIPVEVTPPVEKPKAENKSEPVAEQKPAEPQAPRDLLAQLTNTSPPPETLVRTVARRVKIWTPLVVLLGIIFTVVQVLRPLPDAKLVVASGKETFTFGGDKFSMPWPEEGQAAAMVEGGGSLGTYGEEKPTPTASVAKVMTAYVILKNRPLRKGEQGPDIYVDEKAEQDSQAKGESRVPLSKGQKFSQYQLLQMLLIPSANNVARMLARWDCGSESAFAEKMNAEAKSLGMTKTTYTDPSGLDPSTVSTAVDQVKLAEAVMKNEVIRQIVALPHADVSGLPDRLENSNSNLLMNLGVLGIKTGSSSAAGGTLMWAARHTIDGKERLILGATVDQHFKGLDPDAENSLTKVKDVSYKLMKAVQDALTSTKVVSKDDIVGYVDDGLGGRTPLVAAKDLTAVGWPGMEAKLSLSHGGKQVPHSAKSGTEIGELTVGTGDNAAKVPVTLQKDLAEPGFGPKMTRLEI
ncbi:serine hydrolase [Streptomyces sp. NPDC002537]